MKIKFGSNQAYQLDAINAESWREGENKKNCCENSNFKYLQSPYMQETVNIPKIPFLHLRHSLLIAWTWYCHILGKAAYPIQLGWILNDVP
jgi:hypothetical protein